MTVPAGWYDDGSGRQRWWDGAQWTEHFAPITPTAEAPVQDEDAAAEADATPEPNATGGESEDLDLDATVRREDIPRSDTRYDPPEAAAPATPEAAPYIAPTAPGYSSQDAVSGYPAGAYGTPAYAPPASGNPAYMTPAYAAPAYSAAPEGPKKTPVLGFIALGLAVLGTILVCIPTWFTVIPGMIVLFASLVISVIALFKKNTRKWPAITGIALSVVGGIIGMVVVVVMLFVTTVSGISQNMPSSWPTPMSSGQADGSEADDFAARPQPQMISAGFLLLIWDQPDAEKYSEPGVAACIGEYLYDSELTDDTLWTISRGAAVDDDVYPDVQRVSNEAGDACLTQ